MSRNRSAELDPLHGYSVGSMPALQRFRKTCLHCRSGVVSSIVFITCISAAFVFMALKPSVLDSPLLNNEPTKMATKNFLRLPSPRDETLLEEDPSDRSLLDQCLEEGRKQLANRKEMERSLYSHYLATRKGTPTYYHQQATSQAMEAVYMVDAAVTGEETSKCLRRNGLDSSNMSPASLNYLKKAFPHCNAHVWPFWAVAEIDCMKYKNQHKVRSLDGSCNNLGHSLWGTSFRPYRRILPPEYDDGFSTPRNRSVHRTGGELPPGRQVSQCMQNATNRWEEPKLSMLFLEFGQFLNQDMTSTAASRGLNGTGIPCCGTSPMHPECYPHILKFNDVFYKDVPQVAESLCLDMVRSAPAPQCDIGPRQQMNQASAYIDLSNIYAVTTRQHDGYVRDHVDGHLNSPMSEDGRRLLPLSTDPNDVCNRPDMSASQRFCFKAADTRVNQQIGLTSMYTVWTREHNRVTDQLVKMNPEWNDEHRFQEARRIVVAEMQHITFNEFVPLLIGEQLSQSLRLKPLRRGYSYDYDTSINADISNEFATAAFRFGHSMLQGLVAMEDANHSTENIELHRTLFNPFPLWTRGKIDAVIRGSAGQKTRPMHTSFTTQVANHLFQQQNGSWGLDLFAINIQRGRDHGIPPYFKWREICNLSSIADFTDMVGHFRPHSLELIQRFYKTAVDLDLYTGILAENPLPDGILGPVGSCIITEQFVRLKRGDRFWYETSDKNLRFTPEQLASLRKVTFARILCDNGDSMDAIQERAMESVGRSNPKKRCSQIPQLNLKLWAGSKYIDSKVSQPFN